MSLPEASFELTQEAMQEHNRHKGDENLYVKFFTHPVENHEETIKEGRPMYRDAEFISIMVPGDKDNIVVREVREQDKQRFPRHYAAYAQGKEELIDGTPLERWGFITMAQVEELKFFNLRTVEQLATVSDSNAQKFMGIQMLKQSAKDYIDSSKGDAPILGLQDKLFKKDQELERLQNTVHALQKRLNKIDPDGGVQEKKGFFSR